LLRIMTYNVHRCVGLDGRLSPERIAEVIASCEADVDAILSMLPLRQVKAAALPRLRRWPGLEPRGARCGRASTCAALISR
jgi:endonuclease/exonuclease/phosphatase family metal-dependent hydrolase